MVKKPDLIILKNQFLILLMVMRMKMIIRSVIYIHVRGIHWNPRVEISIREDGSDQDEISSVRMTKSDVEVLKGATNIVDFCKACAEFYSDEELAWAWLHPELVEVKE